MPNIEYLISSEFHVDKGPSLVFQHPQELPGLRGLPFLAELMIPDQIHKREEDYTLFLLHKNTRTGEFEYKYNATDSEPDPYYVYTIVNNVADSSVRRGSVIKALSLVTKLSYFKHFRPLLIIGLDRCYAAKSTRELPALYQAINGRRFEAGRGPVPLVKKLLLTSILDLPLNDKLYFDAAFRNKLLGIRSASDELFIRRDLSFNAVVAFNNMKIPVKLPLLLLPDTIGDYFNPTDLNLKANLLSLLDATMATSYHNNELTVYGLATPPIVVLINALLTGKRIIFMSYENSAGSIIDHVLSALKLVTGGGILTGFLTRYNVFPMVDVSKVDLLEACASYVAGTINPFFKANDRLWDLFVDLDANTFHVSSQIQEPEFSRHSIVGEDARFLSNLQLSLCNYHDDLTTIQLILRRHINEIVRMLISSRNYHAPQGAGEPTLLMDGVGYFWHSDTTKLLEMTCYQAVAAKFQALLFAGQVSYSLSLPSLANELNLMIDLQHQMQKLNNVAGSVKNDERQIWLGILKYLVSGKALETFLLTTYLTPPSTSTSVQSPASHGGGMTIFDKNKGIELLLINLFNEDNQIKANILMIVQELQESFFCGWCLKHYFKSNCMYELALEDLMANQKRLMSPHK